MKKGIISSLLALTTAVFFVSLNMTGQDAPTKDTPAAKGDAPKEGGKGGFGGKGGGFGKGKGGPPAAPAGPFTRLPDGHPDMQGYWTGRFGNAVTNIESKGKGPIVDPAEGNIPWRPEAAAKAKDIAQNHMVDEPELHCF